MAFDKTYLLKQLNVVRTRMGKGLVGTAWRELGQGTKEAAAACFLQLPDASQNSESGQTESQDQNLLQKLDLANVDFAEEMMVALQWDPSTKIKGLPRFPVLELPMSYQCGMEEMLSIIGRCMEHSGFAVRSLVFDGHASHRLIKECLLGHRVSSANIPFFGALEFEPLPVCTLMSFNFSVPKYRGEPIYALNGPAHIQYLGLYFCD